MTRALVGPKLEEAMQKFGGADDPAAAIFGATAKGALRAGQILAGKYHLVVTNVPYLARGKQGTKLAEFCTLHHRDAKADLATAFVERALRFCAPGGSVALVTPQNWLFLGSYKTLRQNLLQNQTWNLVARLGPGAFETIGGEVVNVALCVLTQRPPQAASVMAGIDASAPRVPAQKADLLREGALQLVTQAAQLKNPDARVALEEHEGGELLEKYATSNKGITSNDDPFFIRKFWELPKVVIRWEFHLTTVDETAFYGGYQHLILYENGQGRLRELAAGQDRDRGRDKQGQNAWTKKGIAVSCMRELPVALYDGAKFDTNVAVIVPKDPTHLPAIWAF